ncbi:MAG: hypothetical protein HQK83_00425 [Fibrobacteria bacterium]|nr:hypothetical protein [Fibrobacteria bacterium]
MKHKNLKSAIVFFLSFICLGFTQTATENATKHSFIRGTRLFTGVHLEYWGYRETNSLETVLPIYYSMDLNNYVQGLSVDLVTSPMFGSLMSEKVTNNESVLGLSNTKARASYNFNNLIISSFGIQVPTGSNEQSLQQQNTVSALSTRNYHFRVSQIGSGLDLDFTVSSSYELFDDFIVGFGAGFLTHGPFTPVEDGLEYNPGEEISAALGADYLLMAGSRQIKFIGDAIFTYYTTDKLDDKDYYQSGFRLNLSISASTRLSPAYYNTLNLVLALRGDGKFENGPSYQPGNELLISDYVHFLKHKKFNPFVLARVFLFGENEFEESSAQTFGLGGGGSLKLNNLISARAELIIDAGLMDKDLVFGTEVNGGLNYDF